MRKILLMVALLCTTQLNAAVFNIANGDVAALIAAINTANANSEADIINLAMNGTYTLTAINFTSTMPNTSGNASQRGLPRILNDVTGLDLTINGNGATIIRDNAAPNFGIFAIAGQTIIKDLTVRNGNVNAQGAGIFVEFKGNLELTNCKFYDNTSTLDNEGGGGAIYTKSLSVLRVTDCYFENNKAVNQGGAISNLLSDMYVINSIFKNNRTTDLIGADPCGGAIYDDGARGDNGELVVRGCTFEGNTSNGLGQGGAVFLFPYRNQSAEVTGCTFKSNSANQGGAFWHKGGGSMGIPDPDYPLTAGIENTTLLFNTCVFDGNTALTASGGALWISDCILNEIHSCTFKNNNASLGGAIALLTNRAFTLRNSTFNNNTANQSGGIFVNGITAKLTVQNCTFVANIANQYGGAMSVPKDAAKPVDIINCTFINNQANNPTNGQSAAIHASSDNMPNTFVMIKNCLFANNTVTNAWGVWRDCNCILNDGGNNMFFPAGVSTNCVGTPNFVNPLVGTLSDNGGLTQTVPILTGSPAINAGAGCPTTDQRGVARVGACDIGAFEFGASACNLVVSSNADAGANTLREAISCAISGQTITFAPSMANQTIMLAATLEIPVNKNLTIDGLAAANLTISGNNTVRVFLLKSTSVQPTTLNLKNLKIINGRTIEYGGGIKSEHQGKINLENCVFNNNRADDGGSAVFSAFEGYLTIKNCNFDANTSIANNTERGSTVMIWGPYAHTIQNCNFTNNKGINGAAINGLNAGLLIEDCNFTGNLTTDAFFDTGKPNDFLRGFGGAIYTDRATPATPTSLLGSIIIRRSKFEGNRAEGEGGACYLYTDDSDNVLIEDCYFNDNEVSALTGGTSGGSGGAIQHMNNVKNKGFVLKNTTFSNNKAGVVAGAVRVDWADTEITNCTFDNNRALLTSAMGWSANGGALAFFSMSGSTVNITNNTFANNYAGWVGGAIAGPTTVRIKNNIFFQNTAGNGGNGWNISHHASDNFTDLGNNIQFPNRFTSNWNDYNVSTTVTIANALLNPLANNGGFSPTMSLQAASPAINAGAGCPPTDQRGNARIGICDIGAFEFGGVVTPIITVNPITLTGFSTITSVASPAQTYNLKGANLTTDITVTAPTDYEVSLDGTTFANSVTALIANVQAVAGQTISVRIKSSAGVGSPAGDVSNASMGAVTKNVALTGTVGIAGSIIYVRTNGNDANNGFTNTAGGAKLTLQGGFTAVNDAGTVVLNAGTYNEVATLTGKSIILQSVGSPIVQTIIMNGTGKTITLVGSLHISELVNMQEGTMVSNGNLTLLSSSTQQGMLLQSTGTNVTGNVNVQRFVTAYPARTTVQGYNYFSSPVSGKTIAEFNDNVSLVLNPAYDFFAPYSGAFPNFYKYVENRLTSANDAFEKGWESPASLSENLEVGRGYILNLNANTLIDFSGGLNNGDINIPISRGTLTNSGWNLVGNPYPSTLDWDMVHGFGTNNTKVASTILRRIATGTYSGTWASYNAGVGGLNGGTKDIALGQGFLVKKTSVGNDNLNLTNAMRNTNGSQFFRTEESEESKTQGVIKVKLTSGKWADETMVYFKREASEKYEEGLDILKSQLNSNPAPNLYTSVSGKKIAFNAQSIENLPKEIPLHFYVASNGQHEISLSELRNFKENIPIYLEDKKLKTTQDLREKAYTFSANAGTDTARFVLKFDVAFATEIPDESLTIYPNPATNELKINIDSRYKGGLQIRLTDILGREVSTQTHEKQFTQEQIKIDISKLSKGVYFVEVSEVSSVGTKVGRTKVVKE